MPDQPPLSLTEHDIRRAAEEGVIARTDATRLVEWGYAQHFEGHLETDGAPAREPRKGLNLVTVAYYFGAMLMISACAWFLGDKWEILGSKGIFITTSIYFAVAVSIGAMLRKKEFPIAGGLLVTVGVCLVPLLTYTVEDMLGVWPDQNPGKYEAFYPWINGSWIVMELATITAALVALKFVRFSFLTAPMAFSFWFLSMDIAALISGTNYLGDDKRKWCSVVVGAVMLVTGWVLDRLLKKDRPAPGEDFAFWSDLFGMLAFWGGLTAMHSDSEASKFIYAMMNVGFIGVSVWLRRSTFLVFGALGVHLYLWHLAEKVFKDSFFFPFALALLGLSFILVTVFVQRRLMPGRGVRELHS